MLNPLPSTMKPARKFPIEMNIASDPLAVRAALQTVDKKLITLGMTKDSCLTVQLVLAEALNNIVKHAYSDIAGAIELTIQPLPNHLRCDLTDVGHAMPLLELPQGRTARDNTALPDLPEGGFGWLLIRRFTQDLGYHRQDGKNHLCFVISTERTDTVRHELKAKAPILPH